MRTVCFTVCFALLVGGSACGLYFDDHGTQNSSIPDAGSTIQGDAGVNDDDANVDDGGTPCGDDGGFIDDAGTEDAGSWGDANLDDAGGFPDSNW